MSTSAVANVPPVLRTGLAFARSSFLRMLAYRIRYLVGVINYFLYVSVQYYLLLQVKLSSRNGLAEFADGAEILTYLAIAWAARAAYYNSIDMEIAEQVIDGSLAVQLIRPAPFPWMKYAEAAGETVFRTAFISAPVLILLAVVYYPRLQPPPGLGAVALLALSLLLSFNLYFALNFLTGLVALLSRKAEGFFWAKFLLVQLLSGVLLPLSMFPPSIAPALKRSPFAGLGHTPVLLYQGKLSGWDAAEALLWQAGWTVVLLTACGVGWRWAARRLSIQGG